MERSWLDAIKKVLRETEAPFITPRYRSKSFRAATT